MFKAESSARQNEIPLNKNAFPMKFRVRWLLIALAVSVFCFVAGTSAADDYILSKNMAISAPVTGVSILEDASQEIDVRPVISGDLDHLFLPRAPEQTSLGITNAQWWLRFETENQSASPIQWVINFPFAIMDEVDIHHVLNGTVVDTFRLGDKRPRDERPLPGNGLAAPLITPAGMTSIVYVRFLNRLGDSVDTYFEVSSVDAFTKKQNHLSGMFGAVLGGGILLFLYNLIVFIFVRSRVYFWYLCYFACALASFCFATGIIGNWMPTHASVLSEAVPPIISSLTFMLVIQFSRSFLETASTTPRVDILLRCAMVYFLLPPALFLFGDGAMAAILVMTGGLALSALPLFGAWLWYHGNKRARTFTLAWSVWSIAVSILVSRFLGIAPTNDFTLNIAWLGILMEAVLFALALAERMLLLSREKMEAERRERETVERSKRGLEELVNKRTAELRDKNDQLADINRQKDRFFSIIAHDLIGPFNTLIGGSYFLKANSANLSNEKISEYATDLNTASVNLHKLLENLLSWAQLQKGEIKCTPTNGDLSTSIIEIVDLFRPVAQQKGIDIIVIAPDKLSVPFDANIVQTIVRNLLNNAVKFSHPQETIEVTVTKSKSSLSISIKDTGVGISSEKLDKLLSLDHKSSTKGTSGEKGSGLGLQLCKELSELHGGNLVVESIENRGSTFTFTLPLNT